MEWEVECEVPGVEAGRGVRGRLGGGARGGAMDFDCAGLGPTGKTFIEKSFFFRNKSLVYSVFSGVASLLLYTNPFFFRF